MLTGIFYWPVFWEYFKNIFSLKTPKKLRILSLSLKNNILLKERVYFNHSKFELLEHDSFMSMARERMAVVWWMGQVSAIDLACEPAHHFLGRKGKIKRGKREREGGGEKRKWACMEAIVFRDQALWKTTQRFDWLRVWYCNKIGGGKWTQAVEELLFEAKL